MGHEFKEEYEPVVFRNKTHDIWIEWISPIIMNMERPYDEKKEESLLVQRIHDFVMSLEEDHDRLAFIWWYDFGYGLKKIAANMFGETKNPSDKDRSHTTAKNWLVSAEDKLKEHLEDIHNYKIGDQDE